MTKMRTTLTTVAAVTGVLLVIACGSGGDDKDNASKPSPAATHAGKDKDPGDQDSDKGKDSKPKTKTLLKLSGKGIKKSEIFTTGPEWKLSYTYDCSDFFGGQGNFQVMQYSDGGDLEDFLVNELDKKGHDTVPVHAASGAHYLEMNSECSWTVTVVG